MAERSIQNGGCMPARRNFQKRLREAQRPHLSLKAHYRELLKKEDKTEEDLALIEKYKQKFLKEVREN